MRLGAVDPRQVDQNEMLARCQRKRVGAADRAPHAASQPALEHSALGGHAELVSWQVEKRDVSFEKPARFLMIDQPSHDGDLQDDKSFHRGESGTRVASCAGRAIIPYLPPPPSNQEHENVNVTGSTAPARTIVSDDTELTAFLGEGLVYAGFWKASSPTRSRRSKSSAFGRSTSWCWMRRSAVLARSSSAHSAAAPIGSRRRTHRHPNSGHCRIQQRA